MIDCAEVINCFVQQTDAMTKAAGDTPVEGITETEGEVASWITVAKVELKMKGVSVAK